MINTIHNENCIFTIDKMKENFIDLTITSPPYLNVKDYSNYSSLEEYLNIMEEIFDKLLKKTKESRFVIINISSIILKRDKRSTESKRIGLPFYFFNIMEKIGWQFYEDIIWEKPDGAVYNRNGKFSKFRKPLMYRPNLVTEYILVFKKPSNILIENFTRNNSLISGSYERTNIWKINPERKSKHPAPFPEDLASNLIKYYSYESDLIYDPFMGSGTTAKMAIINKRNFIGSEICKEYVNLANNRIMKYLNQTVLF